MMGYPKRGTASASSKASSWRDVETYGLVAFVALIALNIGVTAIWAFVERIGSSLELTSAQVGQVLSVASFVAIGGPSLSRVVDTRLGYTLPQVLGVTALMLATLLLVYTSDQEMYSVLVPSFLVVFGFTAPFILGVLSTADSVGRLAAAAPAATTLGGSLGALVGGWTADHLGYLGLGWVAAGNFVVVIVLLMIAGRMRARLVAS
jgi:predicted MFS family arabinose efflux permease